MNNSIFVIKPSKWEGLWVFDDANVGLVKEPFVGGPDTMIDVATGHIPNAEKGFLAVLRRCIMDKNDLEDLPFFSSR